MFIFCKTIYSISPLFLIKNYLKNYFKIFISKYTNMNIPENHKRILNKIKELSNNRIKEVSNDNGKMIFISDVKGCQKKDAISYLIQSQYLCSDIFFNDLYKFMSNENNKIAFLGNYFDKGDDFENSINNIIKLKENFNDRIYIILGNRDINKLRILYEVNLFMKKISDEDKIKLNDTTKMFGNHFINKISNFYNNIYYEDLSKKIIKIILQYSMDSLYTDEYVNYYYDIHMRSIDFNKQVKDSETLNRVTNFYKLFEYGKIIDYDKDFKVLLSHSSGIGTFPLHNDKYYKNILKNMFKPKQNININNNNEINNNENNSHDSNIVKYFKYIEYCRKCLMKLPSKNNIIDLNNLKNNSENNSISTYNEHKNHGEYTYGNTSKKINLVTQKYSIDNILEILNYPIYQIINSYKFLRDNISEIDPKYFLLQALTLGPDNIEQDHFCSVVQSSHINNCKGPFSIHSNIFKDQNLSNNLSVIEALGIKFMSFGHSTICSPIPLIFKRRESNIIFILNNSYRELIDNKITYNKDPIPISCITKIHVDKYKVGIKYFDENSLRNYNISSKKDFIIYSKSYFNEEIYLKYYAPMLGNWNLNSVPLFNNNNHSKKGSYNIIYSNKSLHFNKNKKNQRPEIINTHKNEEKVLNTICNIISKYH